jgi:type VI secretion system protein ImpJ
MRNLSPVIWSEGLFLRPHHFQQQDRYHEDRLGLHLELLDRFHWGVAALEVERSALKNRVVEVSRAVVAFPSGAVAVAPENAQVDPRSFADHLQPAGQPIEVFLGLPRLRTHEPNVVDEESPGHGTPRYRMRSREIRDEVSGERPTAMEFAVGNLRLLFGDEDRGAFECVKIAEVVQKGAELFELVDAFVPACLRVDAVPELLRLCSRVRDAVSATARTGHGLKPERAEVDPNFAVRLVTVNSYVALVNHLLGSGNVHPFAFYSVMASLAGAMSSFSRDAEAWDVPPYLHESPGPTFRETAEKIDQYLDLAFPRKYTEVRLSWNPASSCYEAGLSDDHFSEGFRYCLSFAADRPPEAIRTQVHGTAKVGAPEKIPTLRNLALRGVAIRPLDVAPSEIPRRAAAYFQVEPIGPEWDKVREVKRLAVYLPALTDLAVSLFVIRP